MKIAPFPTSAVLFDWDGTLLNSYKADLRAYLWMFHAMGINWTERELAQHYSPNWLRVYRAAMLPRSKWLEADRLWMRAYKLENPPLLAGARRVVRLLAQKYDLGIVTSGNRQRVRRQLRQLELAGYFSACVCSEDAAKKNRIRPRCNWRSNASAEIRRIACTLAIRLKTSKWLAAPECAPSAFLARFPPPLASAPPNPKCS